MHPDKNIHQEAIRWATLAGDPSFEGWEELTLWLEGSPEHAAAYDEAIFAVESAAQALTDYPVEDNSPFEPANDDAVPAIQFWQRRWFSPALAASLAALAIFGVWQSLPDGGDVYATQAGETRMIALEDGSTIELAGGSRLIIADARARRAQLEQGQALFRIRHDETQPFHLVAGNDTLIDAGTIFDVRLGHESLDVAVAEGAVILNPQTRNLRLDAGERATRTGNSYEVGAISTAEVGEWTEGRITFRDALLSEIAADLSRATGTRFTVAPGKGKARLSGSIILAPVSDDPRSLEPLLGVRVRRQGDGWALSAD